MRSKTPSRCSANPNTHLKKENVADDARYGIYTFITTTENSSQIGLKFGPGCRIEGADCSCVPNASGGSGQGARSGTRRRAGAATGGGQHSVATAWIEELVYNDELTAVMWALNSAVECHPHTSSISNTFNNLTRLPGTAKYLKIRAGHVSERVRVRVQSGPIVVCNPSFENFAND